MANIADPGASGHKIKCSGVDNSGMTVCGVTVLSSLPCKGHMLHSSASLAAECTAYVKVTSLL